MNSRASFTLSPTVTVKAYPNPTTDVVNLEPISKPSDGRVLRGKVVEGRDDFFVTVLARKTIGKLGEVLQQVKSRNFLTGLAMADLALTFLLNNFPD
ncbi:hypothetical protein [Sabulibacter ruber]|uniref:hypothetical protein n=1 Tax=Sabulibacter ruber TaxID=2811901 RepID=UPI001A96AD91|nr:hypothetical protein [Sabulibacter ruber]